MAIEYKGAMQIFDTPKDPAPLTPFRQWMEEIDTAMNNYSGVGVDIFPKEDYAGLWEEGLSPEEAVYRIFE